MNMKKTTKTLATLALAASTILAAAPKANAALMILLTDAEVESYSSQDTVVNSSAIAALAGGFVIDGGVFAIVTSPWGIGLGLLLLDNNQSQQAMDKMASNLTTRYAAPAADAQNVSALIANEFQANRADIKAGSKKSISISEASLRANVSAEYANTAEFMKLVQDLK